MSGQSGASPFLFSNKKPTFKSRSKSFAISSPVKDGMAIIGVEGKNSFLLLAANETFLKNINTDEIDPVGANITKIFWGDNIEDDRLHHHLEKAYQKKTAIAFIWQLFIGNKKKSLLCKIIPLQNKSGKIDQITVTTAEYNDAENLEVEVERVNYFDPLTGLANRFKFFETMEEKLKTHKANVSDDEYSIHGMETSVLFINIKKMQRVNDSYGYSFGDKVLKAVSEMISDTLHKKAYLARFSNDKFVVFLSEENFDNVTTEANKLAQSIHHNFATKQLLSESDIRLSVSIGIASGIATSDNIQQLLQNAHLAMKRNDDMRNNQTIIYNQDFKTQAVTKLRLETEFREALEKDALELHYQPLVNLQSGLVCGFEALARWNNSKRGQVSPLEFIALAEEAGLIIPLGEWALTTACERLKAWIDADPLASSLFMAVNVSSSHILTGNIAALTRDALAKSGLDGANLKLELTESTIMENSDIARNILLDLKTYGISLAVDDFGTGYSSLSYLSRIPADTIKIDRSFVAK
ncbi:MAG: EAL domain-containing protein [Kordiimonadaceae bacterium]|mgnify:CR=1 FL=1|jgi:diguanylate cyclase (GGDEF)-like protein|nr:EAL domain-containing protein [Kordiimonadaceae bacterium]